jgi:hypothetical protein
MEAAIAMLEIEASQRPPTTTLGCAQLLRVAEQILTSQEESRHGPLAKGDVRRLILAAIDGLLGGYFERGDT